MLRTYHLSRLMKLSLSFVGMNEPPADLQSEKMHFLSEDSDTSALFAILSPCILTKL